MTKSFRGARKREPGISIIQTEGLREIIAQPFVVRSGMTGHDVDSLYSYRRELDTKAR